MTVDYLSIRAVSMVSAKNDQREALNCVYFSGSYAVATDGHIIARTPCGLECGLKDAQPYRKMKSGLIDEQGNIIEFDSKIEPAGVSDVDFPKYQDIFAKVDDNKHLRVVLSVAVLDKLVKSLKKLPADKVVLEFSENGEKPIKAACLNVSYVLMPMKQN